MDNEISETVANEALGEAVLNAEPSRHESQLKTIEYLGRACEQRIALVGLLPPDMAIRCYDNDGQPAGLQVWANNWDEFCRAFHGRDANVANKTRSYCWVQIDGLRVYASVPDEVGKAIPQPEPPPPFVVPKLVTAILVVCMCLFATLFSTRVSGDQVVADYPQLIKSTDAVVEVTHPERGGMFYLSADQTSVQNSATRFRRSNGTYVDREWDGSRFTVDWFSDTEFFPHTGLLKAIKLLDGSATIVGLPGKVYQLTRECSVTNYSVRLADFHVRRGDAPNTELTVSAPNSATMITVASTVGFRVGDRVGIATSADYHDSINYAYTPTITSITSTTITVSGKFTRMDGTSNPWAVGSKVFRVNRMLRIVTNEPVTIERCSFDGNEQGNNWTYSWVTNTALLVKSPQGLIRDCLFFDSPCESIMIQGNVQVDNCVGLGLWGSFCHMGVGFQDGNDLMLLTNNLVDGVCLSGELAQHSEGCVTWSANVPDVVIDNCDFRNGTLNGLGNLSSDDGNLLVRDTQFTNFTDILWAYGGAVPFGTRVDFDGCTFNDSGDLIIDGTNAKKGYTYTGWSVNDCAFNGNSGISASECENFEIVNSTFESRIELFSNFRNGLIQNVVIDGTGPRGLRLDFVSSNYSNGIYWSSGVVIENVLVRGFTNGIVGNGNLSAVRTISTAGWQMNNVTVEGVANSSGAIGLEVPPGAVCSDLTVVTVDPGQYPVLFGGLNVDSELGCSVTGYHISGASNSGPVMGSIVPGRSNWGIVAVQGMQTTPGSTNYDPARSLLEYQIGP